MYCTLDRYKFVPTVRVLEQVIDKRQCVPNGQQFCLITTQASASSRGPFTGDTTLYSNLL